MKNLMLIALLCITGLLCSCEKNEGLTLDLEPPTDSMELSQPDINNVSCDESISSSVFPLTTPIGKGG